MIINTKIINHFKLINNGKLIVNLFNNIDIDVDKFKNYNILHILIQTIIEQYNKNNLLYFFKNNPNYNIHDIIDPKLIQFIGKREYKIFCRLNKFIIENDIKLNYNNLHHLLKIRGINNWTINTVKIKINPFSDIFLFNDKKLFNKFKLLYNLKKCKQSNFIKISNDWKPYRSLVIYYLMNY